MFGCLASVLIYLYAQSDCHRLKSTPELHTLPIREMVGQVAVGGRTKKPMLEAGNVYHKFRVKRKCWPKVRGVIMITMEKVTISTLGMPVMYDVMLLRAKG